MDWRLLGRLLFVRSWLSGKAATALVAAIVCIGCSRSADNGAARPPEQETAGSSAGDSAAGDSSAQTHRPVIVGPETTTTMEFPDAVVEGDLHRPTGDYPTAPEASAPFLPEGSEPTRAVPMQPSTSSARTDFNPLRIGADTEEPNPLRTMRTFSTEPRIAISPGSSPEFMPEESSEFGPTASEPSASDPSGGSAPAASADPEFHAMAIEPGDGAAAGGSMAPAASASAPAAGPFDVVQVFYGTDRASIEPVADDWPARILRFLPVGVCLLLTLCLMLIAGAKKSTALWTVAAVAVLACIGLGYQAASSTVFAIRWSGKSGPQYTIDRAPGGKVQLGVCEVTIPKTHKPGELESPSILRLEIREDAARHVVLSKTERLADEAFYELLRKRVQASSRKELFVFIHGFDTQFEDAARRTAQIHYDLKFEGAPVFYSWPANNKSILTYPADETTIGWSTPHLKQFLLQIVQQSGAQSINLIAHSMGNRALTVALKEIELEFRGQSRLFNHVVLAAPDIDAADFRDNIAPAMQRTANHITLYASSRDDALRISQLLHRGPRAGDSGRGLVVLPGMDTIDVTAIDSSPWGHIYYGASDPVLQDLKLLFLYGHPPQERRWLSPAQREGLTYWIFEASRTAARSGVGVQ